MAPSYYFSLSILWRCKSEAIRYFKMTSNIWYQHLNPQRNAFDQSLNQIMTKSFMTFILNYKAIIKIFKVKINVSSYNVFFSVLKNKFIKLT